MTLPHPVPTRQGANDPTFKPPPLDGSLTIPELYLHQAQHTPDRPLYVYADVHKAQQTIRYRDAALAIDRAAAIVLDHADVLKAKRGEKGSGRMTFGILAVAGECLEPTKANMLTRRENRQHHLRGNHARNHAMRPHGFLHLDTQLCGCNCSSGPRHRRFPALRQSRPRHTAPLA